jgi:uncharacterized protein YcbK (DUF882 family)
MGDITKNFSRHEFLCPGHDGLLLDPMLPRALQTLRDLVGQPIHILSAYRTYEHNRKVGGSVTSQHLWGRAADITIANMSVEDMYHFALQVEEFKKGGIGLYPDQHFIHVDVRGNVEPARWAFVNGRQVALTNQVFETNETKEEREETV